ncbi:MAG: hypothetical protein ACLFUU_08445 [Desulfobacteraceae bacterium]
MSDCLSLDCLPAGMLRNNREPDQDFAPEEDLFIRFKEYHEDLIIPIEIKSVNQSLNRSKHGCQPEWILLPCYKKQGYVVFKVKDVPPFMMSSAGDRYDFQIEHIPEDYNYCHSEIWVYKGKKQIDRIRRNSGMKRDFRMRICERMQVVKYPDK